MRPTGADDQAGGMSTQCSGTVNVDIRDSTPDWRPFEPPQAPDGAPSVVYIVLDDVGFSAMSCYGGPIQTRCGTARTRSERVASRPSPARS
jgi:hypothetical protein